MVLEAQDNPFTSILMVEAADPEALAGDADPAVGQRRLVVGADHILYLLSDAGVKTAVGAAAVTRASLGLATSDSPEFAGLNIGHASDTTLARTAAGELAVEGNRIFRVGGADVPVADGGTGASSASAARTNLGLVPGTDVASLTAGVVPIAQLATGTPTGSKFIRDDGTLQVPAGGGGAALTSATKLDTSGNHSISTTSFAAVDTTNLRVSLTTTASATVLLMFSSSLGVNGGAQGHFSFQVDGGGAVGGTNGIILVTALAVSAINYHWIFTGLSAAAHTFDVMAKVTGNTADLGQSGSFRSVLTAIQIA